MYNEVESKFSKTVKLTKFLTYVFLFLSLLVAIYFIITLSISSEQFTISQSESTYLLSFNKSFSINIIVGNFTNVHSVARIKTIYSFIVLVALTIAVSITLILFNILKIFNHSSSQQTPFNLSVIKHLETIKWLLVAIALLPNVMGCIIRYVLNKQSIVLFDNAGFLIPLFVALILNVMKYIFLYGIELQNEYDSLL
ncbi:MAG: hypothetical protein WCZ27_11105 [Tissierellaceae bacterium]